MKQSYYYIILLLFISINCHSQAKVGDHQLNVSLELRKYLTSNINIKTTFAPINFSYERYVTDKISVGGLIVYSKSSWQATGQGQVKINFVNISAFGNYHFYQTKNLDFYSGAKLGVVLAGVKADKKAEEDYFKNTQEDNYKHGGLFSVHVGGRYFFTDEFGAMLEVAYGRSLVNVGFTYKLPAGLFKAK